MSGSTQVPAGIDVLSAEETALLDSMRNADAAPEPTPHEPEPMIEVTAPESAPSADPEPAQPPHDKRQTAPVAAIAEERRRRREAEARAVESERKHAAQVARLEERLNLLTQAAQAATQPAPAPAAEAPIPDVNQDPIGHFRAVNERLQRQLETQRAVTEGLSRQQRDHAAAVELQAWGAAQERAYEAAEPTYRQAMAHLEASRRAELTSIGVVDPMQQAQLIGNDIRNIALRARAEGADFAERLYRLAEARGFKKQPSVPPIDAPLGGTLDAAGVAQRQAAGRANATTIGSAGAAPPTRLTAEKIADMPEVQFAKLLDDFRKQGRLHEILGA